MRVFTCNDHYGHYPVGASSVVVAEDEHQAFSLLKDELERQGIKDDRFTLVELDITKPRATVLDNGEY